MNGTAGCGRRICECLFYLLADAVNGLFLRFGEVGIAGEFAEFGEGGAIIRVADGKPHFINTFTNRGIRRNAGLLQFRQIDADSVQSHRWRSFGVSSAASETD